MKKNKNSRLFSRVLSRLAWANFYHVCEENENAYKEVLAAKRHLEECGCDDIKVDFYEREYHIHFAIYRAGYDCNRYYTVDASHGYHNDYHNTNKANISTIIQAADFVRDCSLRMDYHDYQRFLQVTDSVIFWALEEDEYLHFSHNGCLDEIPYNVAIDLYRSVCAVAREVVYNAIAYKKVVL